MNRTDERNEFLTDVLTTAVEGGINYWATIKSYKWDTDVPAERHASVKSETRGSLITVDLDALASAIRKITAKDSTIKLAPGYVERIKMANSENDAGYLDAFDADAIFQVAALGEVIYG